MVFNSKVTKKNMVSVPDIMKPYIEQTYKSDHVRVFFGINMDIAIVCADNKQLSKDNLERIRILTEVKQ